MTTNILRPVHLEFDLDNLGGLVDAGLSPELIAQELTTALNPYMPAAVSLEVCSIQGREAYIDMRDGMSGAAVTQEISLFDWDDICRDARRVLSELEEAAAIAEVGIPHVPFAKRTYKRIGRAVLTALQTKVGAGAVYVGTTHGIALYKCAPGVFVGVEMADAHKWASVLDDQVTALRAMQK